MIASTATTATTASTGGTNAMTTTTEEESGGSMNTILTNDEEHDLLIEALEALKDIVNAAGNGLPYSEIELTANDGFVLGILNRAHDGGIRLNGEEERASADDNYGRPVLVLNR